MPDRAAELDRFLSRAGWADADRTPLAGDASQRRYERLERNGESAVLMDAPPERGEDVGPFLTVGEWLSARGFSAPRVLAEDRQAGLLLLEDLGDDLYARVLAVDPERELRLYEAAVDALVALHRHPPLPAPTYGPEEMTRAAGLAYAWYLRGAGLTGPAAEVEARVRTTLEREAPGTDVLVLRDFHAENLIWLPERRGTARVGLLDFQDAAAGHRAYDLASLVTDIRREVAPSLRAAMEARYAEATGVEVQRLRAEVALLSVQRNLRILGTFARLAIRDGKTRYLDYLPRVWTLLHNDLRHPVSAGIAERVLADLPPPTPDVLARLAECRTAPAL